MPLDINTVRATVSRFAGAVIAADPAGIAEATTADIVWTIPGTNAISGELHGHDSVATLAKTLKDFGYEITLIDLTFGTDTVAVVIRATGTHNGKSIDLAVVNVLRFRDGKVASVATHYSDLDALDSYFA